MLRPLVFFLVALGVTDVAAVGLYNTSVGAKGMATCNYNGFDQRGNENGTVSIILRRGPSNNQREGLVLATVPVIRGKYSVSGTTDGDNLVYIMEFFLRLTYTCAELSTFDMVQIPGRAIVHGPPIPSRAFQHDFNERFDGP